MMAFHIFNSKGFRVPYNPEQQWREVEGVVPPAALDERSRDEAHPHQQEGQEKREQSKKWEGSRFTPIVASQIMSYPVTTLLPDAKLKEAWELFDKKRFRHIPIISTDGKIIGIITDRVMLHETNEFVEHTEGEVNRLVSEVMATNVLCADLNADISHIAKIFIDEQISAMPVVDINGTLKGLVTSSDILRTIIKIHPPNFRI